MRGRRAGHLPRNSCRSRTRTRLPFGADREEPEAKPLTVQIDTREKDHAIRSITAEFDKQGVRFFRSKLYVGDYQLIDNGRLVVDRKQNLTEIAQNLTQQHERFRDELIRAQSSGIKLVVLCEHGGKVRTIEDVEKWTNPRLKKNPGAMTGSRMAKVMRTVAERYGVTWVFCDKRQTGKKILELLREGLNGKE